ncbi:MFS transporter, partial [Rhizobium johnstonii]
LSPDEVRGTFPGFAYQLGNLLALGNATLQAGLAARWDGDYAYALLSVAAVVALVVAALAGFGYEKKDVRVGTEEAEEPHGAMRI